MQERRYLSTGSPAAFVLWHALSIHPMTALRRNNQPHEKFIPGALPMNLLPLVDARYDRNTMAVLKLMLNEFPWDERYRVHDLEQILTPALVVYPELIASNIERTLALLSGDADRWRVHIKTAKLGYTVHMLIERGVRNFKCATTLELITASDAGAADVLLAYPVMGANARRVREIADQFPRTKISVLAENDQQVAQWRESRVGVFLDINPGMNRTGIAVSERDRVCSLIRQVQNEALEFRGLHYYDGQYGGLAEPQRSAAAHAGYDQLLELVRTCEQQGLNIPELITAGTPTFPASLSYAGFTNRFIHRISPGTIVYGDATSLAQLPALYGYAPAALVLTRVVSHPRHGIITCDAGHKTVSADAGVPTCIVVGHSGMSPLSPSEEHLPIEVTEGSSVAVGESLFLLPRHICPTVNNFDSALLARDGRITMVEKISARGREGPLLGQFGYLGGNSSPAVSQRS
ncbi:MAG TPA: alanine racemase [Candidatus Sulfotelmatobacter sp.]